MKTAAISGIAAFLSALALLSLGDTRRSVRELRELQTRSEAALGGARAEFDRLRVETAKELSRAPSAPARPEPRDPSALQRDILGPSVQVNVNGSVGGGTLLFSRETHSYVVTAHHVVHKIIVGHDAETRPPAEVTLYTDAGAVADTVEGDLVAWDERKDLALLRLRAVHEYAGVARLASRDTLRSVRVFTPIYAVGCPLGHDPLPTPGEVATLNKELNGERFWMMNAPTIFGNSGGGVFHRDTRELIGVSVMVCTYDGAVSTPVPHLGILVSLDSVYDWLDSLNYNFIYDPEFPLEAFEALHTPRAPSPSIRPEASSPAPTGGFKR